MNTASNIRHQHLSPTSVKLQFRGKFSFCVELFQVRLSRLKSLFISKSNWHGVISIQNVSSMGFVENLCTSMEFSICNNNHMNHITCVIHLTVWTIRYGLCDSKDFNRLKNPAKRSALDTISEIIHLVIKMLPHNAYLSNLTFFFSWWVLCNCDSISSASLRFFVSIFDHDA